MSIAKNIFAAVTLLSSSILWAADGTFSFKQIGIVKDGEKVYGIVQLDGTLPSVPSCASGYSNQVSFVIEDDFGKLMYSTGLSAVMTKKQVYMSYSASECGLWGSRAIANRIDVKN